MNITEGCFQSTKKIITEKKEKKKTVVLLEFEHWTFDTLVKSGNNFTTDAHI